MDFDFTTETITPDTTTILTIGGTGALELPVGTTGQQPVSGISPGAMRFNTNGGSGNGWVEYYDQSPGWKQFPNTSAAVSSFQTSLSGLTPSTATTGVVTLAGTLGATSGGTGTTTAPTAGQLMVGVTGGTYIPFTVTSGTGISTTTGSGTFQINNTGVTSAVGTAGNITVSAATGAVTFNLGAVTQSTGSNFVKVTLDGFGRVTGNTAVSQGDLTTILSTYYLPTAGGTMSGAINMGTNQINNLGMSVTPAGTDAVNVNYVQAQLTGLSWKQAVKAATTGILTANYSNGVSGVGATLTATTNVVLPNIDTISLAVTDRVLVKNQGNTFENGIYTVTSLGSAGSSPWVLTRATDSDTAAEVDGSAVYVQQGGSLADTGWTETATMTAIGAGNAIIWAQFSGSGAYTAGAGLTLTGNSFSITAPVAPTLGGTGTTTAPTAGQILIGTSGNVYAPATLTAGTAIGITSASGSITINNTGVTSAVGTAGNITVSAATGAVTFNLATAGTAGTYGVVTTDAFGRVTAGTVIAPVANGGTGVASLTTNGVLFGGTTVGATAAGATGQVLIGTTGSAPSWSTLSGLAVTSIAGTTNQITASASTGAVTLSTPATFIAPGSIASTTSITAGTTLTVTGNTANSFLYSGTAGLVTTTAAPTNGQLLIGSNGAAPVAATISVSGTSLYVSNGPGSITLSGPKFYSEFTTAPVVAPTATASQAIALGNGSSAATYGVLAYSSGRFATSGDAQNMKGVLRVLTTATGAGQEMFLDGSGASQRLVLPNNSAWTFNIKLVGRRTDATGSIGSWTFTGLIYRDATAATTVISGLSKTAIARLGVITGAGNDPVVSADTTNGSLKVAVSGYGTYNIRWVATVDLVQVTN